MTEWMCLATQRSIVRRALGMTVVVGTVLIAINYSDALLRGAITTGRVIRMCLTLLVPYCVSTYSSVEAIRQRPAARGTARDRTTGDEDRLEPRAVRSTKR